MYNIKTKDGKNYLTELIWRKTDGVIFEHMGEILDIKSKKISKIEKTQRPVILSKELMCS